MKIAYVFQKDSHFKAVHATALRLSQQYHSEPIFIGIQTTYVPKTSLNKEIPRQYLDKNKLSSLAEYDFVVACLGGYLLNYVIRALASTETKVISIFPGIVSHYQLDAFISRLNSDQVWINSAADLKLYKTLCKIFKHPNNAILYGMSWVDLKKQLCLNSPSAHLHAIFFEQTEIFATSYSKQRLSKSLRHIIAANPNVLFKYKIRDNTVEPFFTQLREQLSQFENVEIVEHLREFEIAEATYYLSVSSSALIEGLIYGKQCFIIDAKLLDTDSKEFYKTSGLELKDFTLKVEKDYKSNKWFRERVSAPSQAVNIFSIQKKSSLLVVKTRSINNIRVLLCSLIFRRPSLSYIIFQKPRLKAIQKSLEYISMNPYV